MAFPTLSVGPVGNGWEQGRAFDPTMRIQSPIGYTKTYSMATRVPRQWKVPYAALTTADKALIVAHENSMKIGGTAFDWTDDTGTTVSVRYKEPTKFQPVKYSGNQLWSAQIMLEEV